MKIFEMLGEADLNYQRKLHSMLVKLNMTSARAESLAHDALQRATEPPPHSAGRHFGNILTAEISRRKAEVNRQIDAAAEPKVTRAYQTELAEKVGGKNAIVVCTTGSARRMSLLL